MEFIKTLTSPLFIIVVLLLVAFIMMCGKRKDFAHWLFGLALTSLFFLSFPPFANVLMWGLERQNPPIVNIAKIEKTRYIVVLADWDSAIPTVPYTSNIGYISAQRILEAHRIYQRLRHSRIIISGKKISCDEMQKLLLLLGVPKDEILREDESQNTWESSINVKKLVSSSRFILVTSANHLPRAMICFLYHGLKPIPAPADFHSGYNLTYKTQFDKPIIGYFPNINSLNDSHLAIYEYLGICWYQVKVWLKS